jgi:hypothetical protein
MAAQRSIPMGGDREAGSDPVRRTPNATPRLPDGPRVGSSADLRRLASPVATPDHRFSVDETRRQKERDHNSGSAIEPGVGVVPVDLTPRGRPAGPVDPPPLLREGR